jgi:hypothetical protein
MEECPEIGSWVGGGMIQEEDPGAVGEAARLGTPRLLSDVIFKSAVNTSL